MSDTSEDTTTTTAAAAPPAARRVRHFDFKIPSGKAARRPLRTDPPPAAEDPVTAAVGTGTVGTAAAAALAHPMTALTALATAIPNHHVVNTSATAHHDSSSMPPPSPGTPGGRVDAAPFLPTPSPTSFLV